MEILETIEKTGSINQTAKRMKMSYKAVWSKIKASEQSLSMKIVHTDRKLGTRLNREGRALLDKYRQMKRQCLAADNRIFSEIFQTNGTSESEDTHDVDP
jgi:molybdate transport system regulatory protein